MNQKLYFISAICILLMMDSVRCTKLEEKRFELSSSRTFPGFAGIMGPVASCLMELLLGDGNVDGSCANIEEDDLTGNKEFLSEDLSLYSLFEYLMNYMINNIVGNYDAIPITAFDLS